MEQIANLNVISAPTWLESRYRSLIFSVLSKLQYGQIEISEGEVSNVFPSSNIDDQPNAMRGKINIHDVSVFRDFVRGGSIGAAESFIAGKWSSPDLTTVIRIFAKAQQQLDSMESKKSWVSKIQNVFSHWQNRNSKEGSKKNILAHYDLGNDLFTRFLDPTMMYSSAIYPSAESSLAEAQIHKLDTICQRLELSEGQTLLEIGTGWGGLAIHAAKNYGCHVTTTTISDEQHQYALGEIEKAGLQDKITLLKKDYRELTGKFDKLVSIEMIEAVGFEYLPSFFNQCNERLKPGGKMLLQSITIADQRFEHYKNNVDFIQKYIFPGGFLPSITALSQNFTEHTSLVIESIDDIGLDYAKTLAHWRDNFLAAWSELTQFGYDEQFKRLWLYYLTYCEGAFIERATSTVQVVARK